jgi:hypothetical protein
MSTKTRHKLFIMSASFPLRPEDGQEGFFELFLRTSGVAWFVWLTYRLFESEWFKKTIIFGDLKNSIAIKGSLLFLIAVLATYFTNSSKTRVYRQSIT